ncbi:heavy metal-associated domain-containing protein [Persephonella sp. KM09-Lau-8]|uniref:heavy-metal-associated domain-containing protein n=1 Tax=Persephonella sp. KM09-Lau-8 TaxID=1158345 RepID=UPI000497718B|nr:heavy metal-associated domain-containing protein [Persephonella sp. KM09-Lau-8]
MDKFAVLSVSALMIGGISWFFFGGKDDKNKKKENTGKTETVELNISGMHCAGCVAGIEATLKATDGVISASVNLATSKGVFEYDPAKITKEQIIAKIKELGYDASEDLENFEKKS